MADYQGDWVLKHAVQRGTEIISEASRALPDEVKALQPDIPGRQVRTIGNVLRHEYHGLADNVHHLGCGR
ncbi:HepT-like ribonuclease domain-containing protein [Mesorhizobium sp.]|uniref:HepT-like ribonuclease domain-containing protein n=1 Tax=Mesorhizobium sp. TaxID=1871066 RepID=UPI00344F50D6